MASHSYHDYLRLLNLAPDAAAEQIRAGITAGYRLWAQRTNSPRLDARQEAERMMQTYSEAERVLLGPEGDAAHRNRHGAQSHAGAASSAAAAPVDPETVVRAIERVTAARGARHQERVGTVVIKSSTVFYRGVDYRLEDLVHKKYESMKDSRTCLARRGSLKLFEWRLTPVDPPGQAQVLAHIPGPWAGELLEMLAAVEAG